VKWLWSKSKMTIVTFDKYSKACVNKTLLSNSMQSIYSAAQIFANYAYAYYTSVFCVYAYVNTCTYTHVYTHIYMYIRIRTHVYVHVYVSLLCIPISFFMWSIVGQTKGIVFLGMKKASKRNLHVVRTSCWSMKTIIFQVFDYFANSPTNYCLLTLAWS